MLGYFKHLFVSPRLLDVAILMDLKTNDERRYIVLLLFHLFRVSVDLAKKDHLTGLLKLHEITNSATVLL